MQTDVPKTCISLIDSYLDEYWIECLENGDTNFQNSIIKIAVEFFHSYLPETSINKTPSRLITKYIYYSYLPNNYKLQFRHNLFSLTIIQYCFND